MYLDRFRELRDEDPSLTANDIPRVMTIDSSQGDEAFMVFFDGSAQHSDVIGMQIYTTTKSATETDNLRSSEERVSLQRRGDSGQRCHLDYWWAHAEEEGENRLSSILGG